MPSSFTGMNPYLGQPAFWSSFPNRLIMVIADVVAQYGNGQPSGLERYAREEQHGIAQCPNLARPCDAVHLAEAIRREGAAEWTID